MQTPAIPLVSGLPVFGNVFEFRDRRIELQERVLRSYGEIARLKLGLFEVVMISSPELVQELLVEKEDAFVKSHGLQLFARPLLGDGLLTSEHDFHRKQRRLMAPGFAHARIANYADTMLEHGQRSCARLAQSETADMAEEAMRVTLEIVGKTLFDANVAGDCSAVGEALTLAMESMMRSLTGPVPIPPFVPTPSNLRMRRAVTRLDAIVYRIIAERRAQGVDRGDVLSMLLLAQDDDGSSMSDRQLRDEVMTLFLAGHETTANTLTWSLYLLAKHPEVRERLERELDDALHAGPVSRERLASVPLVRAVIKESMRLYPPAYFLGRRAIRDVSLGGHALRKNQVVLVSVFGIHRNPRVWPEPERFDPERFRPEREKGLPRHAFMPFGAGPRVCIGSHFAQLEAELLLATWMQRFRFELEDPDYVAAFDPLITLRLKGGLPMRIRGRPYGSLDRAAYSR